MVRRNADYPMALREIVIKGKWSCSTYGSNRKAQLNAEHKTTTHKILRT